MKRKLFAAFVAGACVSGFVFAYVLQHTQRIVQDAWMVRQTDKSATIRFYHDATDNVICLMVPIPEFPTTHGRHSGAVMSTVGIWEEGDGYTEELMQTDAYRLEKREIADYLAWKFWKD